MDAIRQKAVKAYGIEQAQERQEEKKIGKIYENQGEEGAVVRQVRLVLGNDPCRPEQVEAPPEAQAGVKKGLAGDCRPEEVRYAPYQSPQHGPERKEVGGKGDKDVVFIRLDVTSVQIRFESMDGTAAANDRQSVRQFMPQYVQVQQGGCEQPAAAHIKAIIPSATIAP